MLRLTKFLVAALAFAPAVLAQSKSTLTISTFRAALHTLALEPGAVWRE